MQSVDANRLNVNRKNVARMIFVQFSGSVISQAMVALVMLLTARQLGPEIYGQMVGSLTLVSTASIVFSLGLDMWLLKEGGRQPGDAGRFAGSVLVIKLSLGSVWLVLMFILADLFGSQSLPASFIRWNAVIVLLDNLFSTMLTTFKATLRNTINALLEVISDTFWLVSTVFLIYFGIKSAFPFFQTRFMVLILSVATAFLLIKWIVRSSSNIPTIKTALQNCLPFAASEFLSKIYLRIDILVVSIFLGEYNVGIYSPAVSIINAIFIIPAAIHMVMVPVLSNIFAHDQRQGWKTARNNLIVMVIVGILLSFVIYFGVGLLPLLLGEAYQYSQGLLKTLSPVPFIHSVSLGMSSILVSTNNQKYRSIVQAVSAATNILLNLIVVNIFGIFGVAVVYIISDIVLLLGYVIIVYKIYKNPTMI